MLLKLSERWELPTSARHSCRVKTLSEAGSRQTFVHLWPLHPPTSYSALPPTTSAARPIRLCKQICDILLHCEQDCRGTCTFAVVSILKAFSQILASRHSAAKGPSWSEKDSTQSSRISSNHSFQEMTHQVKRGAQAQFSQFLIARGSNALPMFLFPSSSQILAVSHLSEVVKSG